MHEPSSVATGIQFGPFTLDVRTGELRKGQTRLKVPDQSIEILKALLGRPGDLITRDELRQRLWSGDTFVDFEHGLNAAVRRLRDALGDSADSPQFIETLPRRGYRFVGQITERAVVGPVIAPMDTMSVPEAHESVPDGRGPSRSFVLFAVALGSVGVVAVLVGAYLTKPKFGSAPATPMVVPLTTYPGVETDPAISPDGSGVAFTWHQEVQSTGDIYVKRSGSNDATRLTNDVAPDFMPKWSPDGQWIAFLRGQSGPYPIGVYRIRPGGGLEQKLGDASKRSLTWSPDGEAVIVSRGARPGQQAVLTRLSIDKGDATPITDPPEADFDVECQFAPNGQLLAFQRVRGGVTGGDAVRLLVSPVSADPHALIRDTREIKMPPHVSPGSFTWSADSNDIIYASGVSAGTGSLWRVSVRGSGSVTQIPYAADGATAPAVSSSPDRLVYSRWMMEDNIWSLAIDATGTPSGPPVRAFDSSRSERNPRFSPDGSRVAFESNRSGRDEIWACSRDGDRCEQLTTLGTPDGKESGGWRTGNPAWSPDGDSIAFDATDREGGTAVYVVGVGGGPPTRLVDGSMPRWSQDGSSLSYIDRPAAGSGYSAVYRLSVRDLSKHQLTERRHQLLWLEASSNGKWLYYAGRSATEAMFLRRIPISGGPSADVLPSSEVEGRNIVVVDDGVWFTNRDSAGGWLKFFPNATGFSRLVYRIPMPVSRGLALAPDGRHILFSQTDRIEANLMLVEHFR